MVASEIDSFVNKFKLLWSAGHDASLSLESKLGEVCISLNCKVGRITPPPSSHFTSKYRSPSYFRRQERRKAARDSVNVLNDASCNTKADEVFDVVNGDEVKADPNVFPMVKNDGNQDIEVIENVTDASETEEVYLNELARDREIGEVLVYEVKGGIPKPPMTKEMAENEITDRFSSIGVNVKSFKTICDSQGNFEQSRVQTTPVNLKNIWGRRLGIKNCAVIAYEHPILKK